MRAPSKYRNVPTVVDGIRFDSKKEAARYGDLVLLQKAKQISGLEARKEYLRYPLVVGNIKVAEYEADFRYVENGVTVVEDAKGAKTTEYRIKRRLMMAVLGIDIRET